MKTKTMKDHIRKPRDFLLVATIFLLYYFALAGPGVPQIEVYKK